MFKSFISGRVSVKDRERIVFIVDLKFNFLNGNVFSDKVIFFDFF